MVKNVLLSGTRMSTGTMILSARPVIVSNQPIPDERQTNRNALWRTMPDGKHTTHSQ